MTALVYNPRGLTRLRWSSDAFAQFSVGNPATGEIITRIQRGSKEQVDAAVPAVYVAFERDWRHRPAAESGLLLIKCADVLEHHADELTTLESLENGKPIADAKLRDINFMIGVFRFFGSLIDKLPTEFHDKGNIYTSVILEPLGVVTAIIPFNWPFIHTGGKVAAALAVGNTVVVKPSEQAPLTIMHIVELINSILPADVVHVLPGVGPAVPQAVTAHSPVKKVTFTGSTKSGSEVAKTAATNVTSVTLELGSKNPCNVFGDAELDRAVRDALDGAFFNKGEACTAASRLLVQAGIHDVFVERLAAGVRAPKTGSGADPSTHVGSCVTKAQQEKVLDYIRIGEEEGATLAAQGRLPTNPELANGFYVPPTMFTGVTRDMRIAVEKIFGPAVTATRFKDEDEAVSIAKESEYGLMCSIYSQNLERAFRVARRIETGMVMMNNYFRGIFFTPFGGVKKSGYGREHAIETLEDFGAVKMIRFPSGLGKIPSWRDVTDIFGESGSLVK